LTYEDREGFVIELVTKVDEILNAAPRDQIFCPTPSILNVL
jgi:hypothetical protein